MSCNEHTESFSELMRRETLERLEGQSRRWMVLSRFIEENCPGFAPGSADLWARNFVELGTAKDDTLQSAIANLRAVFDNVRHYEGHQVKAWEAVFATLQQLVPDWIKDGLTTTQNAGDAIRNLAKRADYAEKEVARLKEELAVAQLKHRQSTDQWIELSIFRASILRAHKLLDPFVDPIGDAPTRLQRFIEKWNDLEENYRKLSFQDKCAALPTANAKIAELQKDLGFYKRYYQGEYVRCAPLPNSGGGGGCGGKGGY